MGRGGVLEWYMVGYVLAFLPLVSCRCEIKKMRIFTQRYDQQQSDMVGNPVALPCYPPPKSFSRAQHLALCFVW